MNTVQKVCIVQNKKAAFWLFLLLVSCSHAVAQTAVAPTVEPPASTSTASKPTTESLTPLRDYIRIGIQNNRVLQNTRLDGDAALSELRASRGRFLPDVSLNASYSLASGGRTIDFPIGDLFNPVYRSLNALSGTSQFPTDLANVSEQLLPDNFHETNIRVVQPLFNSDLYFSYRARRDMVSAEDARLKAATDALVRDITLAYMAYFAAVDQMAILESGKVLVTELIRTTESLVRNDRATIDQLYAAQYELSDIDARLAEAHRQMQTARAYFNMLLHRDLDDTIRRDEAYLQSRTDYRPADELKERATTSRAEFSQLSSSIAAARNLLNMHRGTALPDVSFVGDLGYQGTKYTFGSDQDYAFAQFRLRWSLFRGFQNREKITRSHIEIRQLDNQYAELEAQIRLRVDDAWQGLMAAIAREKAAQDGLKAAESAFRIVKRRYEEDGALLVEYLRAQDVFIRSQLNASLTRYQTNTAEAVLEREAGLQ